MTVKTGREEKSFEVKKLYIEVSGTRYELTESVEGKLTINKPDLDEPPMAVFPQYGNQINVK